LPNITAIVTQRDINYIKKSEVGTEYSYTPHKEGANSSRIEAYHRLYQNVLHFLKKLTSM